MPEEDIFEMRGGHANRPDGRGRSMTRDYTDLRTANVDRQADWCPDIKPDLAFRGCEIAGEVGEVCELLVCQPDGTGYGEWFTDLMDELADCVISLDLMGICVGLAPLDPSNTRATVGPDASLYEYAANLGWRVGMLTNIAKKIERERHGWRGSRATTADLLAAMNDVAGLVNALAAHMQIDLNAAVAHKFNATSEKVGLSHRMIVA